MIPSVVASEIRSSVEDFLKTEFRPTTLFPSLPKRKLWKRLLSASSHEVSPLSPSRTSV